MYDISTPCCSAKSLILLLLTSTTAVGCGGESTFSPDIRTPAGLRLVAVAAERLGFQTAYTTLEYTEHGALRRVEDTLRGVDQRFETNDAGHVTAVVDAAKADAENGSAARTTYRFEGERRVAVEKDWSSANANGVEITTLERDAMGRVNSGVIAVSVDGDIGPRSRSAQWALSRNASGDPVSATGSGTDTYSVDGVAVVATHVEAIDFVTENGRIVAAEGHFVSDDSNRVVEVSTSIRRDDERDEIRHEVGTVTSETMLSRFALVRDDDGLVVGIDWIGAQSNEHLELTWAPADEAVSDICPMLFVGNGLGIDVRTGELIPYAARDCHPLFF